MSPRWSVVVALLVAACGHAAPAPGVPVLGPPSATEPIAAAPATPPPPVGPSAPAPDGWMWIASVSPQWRTPFMISEIVALDARRAIVFVTDGKLAAIDLSSGTVTEHAVDLGDGRATILSRIGGRIIAYGHRGAESAAWAIDPTTLAPTPLPFADPAVGSISEGQMALAVGPDGKRIVTCANDRWPTVRDATTLAAIQVFTGAADCSRVRFVDADHVLIEHFGRGPRLAEVSTGKVTELAAPPAPLVVPGPGGRSVTVERSKVTITGGNGKVVTSYAVRATQPVWLDDGSAVVALGAKRSLVLLPAAAGWASRVVDLPATVQRVAQVPGTTQVVVAFGPHRVAVVDTATGKVTTAAGINLGRVPKIAPLAGTVISSADRLRVWRRTGAPIEGGREVVEAFDVEVDKPVVYASLEGVFATDLADGNTWPIDEETVSVTIDRVGSTVAWDGMDGFVRKVGDGKPTVWFQQRADLTTDDIDLATGRIALNDDDAFYIVRPDKQKVFGFHPYDCQSPLYIWLERGRERAATYDGATVQVYDTAARKGVAGFELTDDSVAAGTFIPGRTALALVADAAIYLWEPSAGKVVAWPLPPSLADADPTSIGVDPTGAEIAVGFDDGAVLWARLDVLWNEARPVGDGAVTLSPGPATRCGKPIVTDSADLVEPPVEGDDEEGLDD